MTAGNDFPASRQPVTGVLRAAWSVARCPPAVMGRLGGRAFLALPHWRDRQSRRNSRRRCYGFPSTGQSGGDSTGRDDCVARFSIPVCVDGPRGRTGFRSGETRICDLTDIRMSGFASAGWIRYSCGLTFPMPPTELVAVVVQHSECSTSQVRRSTWSSCGCVKTSRSRTP